MAKRKANYTFYIILLCFVKSSSSSFQSILSSSPSFHYQQVLGDKNDTILRRSGSDTSFGDKTDSFPESAHKFSVLSDKSCAAEKYALEHEAEIEYVTKFKKLDQFSLCMWVRFTRHDGDHVLFTYSVHDEPREIQFWISNVNSSSFITLAVRGHSLYRLNYPLAMKKWHHMCTSWNGKTGEWQLWVKSERVGRGFYNRLVSHEIESKGKAFSGGKSPNDRTCYGLHFELTLLQLYSVALSAGKAHRDHKHHHVHKFDFNGEISTTTSAPTPPPVVNQPVNPLLANGQFPTKVKINVAQVPPNAQSPTLSTNFVNGQFHGGSRIIQEQLISGKFKQLAQQPQQLPSSLQKEFSSLKSLPIQITKQEFESLPSSYVGFQNSPVNVQIIDEKDLPDLRFKRQSEKEEATREKRQFKIPTDSTLLDISSFDTDWYDGLAQFGDNDFKDSLLKKDNLEEDIKEHDREPAQGEVEAVASYCSYCLLEPFQQALVLSWKTATPGPKVLKAKAAQICGDF